MKTKIKSFAAAHKKGIITVFAVILCLSLFFGAAGIANAVLFDQKCKLGEQIVSGSVPTYNWTETDAFNINDYPSVTVKDGKIRMLALSDTHLGVTGKYATKHLWIENLLINKAYAHIDKLIKAASPDIIIITGDMFTDPLTDIVMQDLVTFLDSYGIPWTVTFGNHDGEWRADKAALCNIIAKSKHTLFRPGPTNIQGLGNSIVNFKDANGNVFYSLITMDTGDWQKIDDYKIWFKDMHIDKRERPFATESVGYSDLQADWYRWVVEGLKAANGGATVETMVAAHIAHRAYEYAIRLADGFVYNNPLTISADAEDYYKTPEQFKNPATKEAWLAAYTDYTQNYKFFSAVKELGSTKDFISGHIHSFGYAVKYDGITYTSVTKTTDIYVSYDWDNGRRGGTYFEFSPQASDGTHISKNMPLYYKEVK